MSYLKEEQEQQINEIFSYYQGRNDRSSQETVVEMLREIQETAGWITGDLKTRAAEAANVKRSFIDCLVRMYPSLKEKDYKHEIILCSGERCGRKGGASIRKKVQQELEGDESVLIKVQNCLKRCKTSPNLIIDGKYYLNVTEKEIPELLKKALEREKAR